MVTPWRHHRLLPEEVRSPKQHCSSQVPGNSLLVPRAQQRKYPQFGHREVADFTAVGMWLGDDEFAAHFEGLHAHQHRPGLRKCGTHEAEDLKTVGIQIAPGENLGVLDPGDLRQRGCRESLSAW